MLFNALYSRVVAQDAVQLREKLVVCKVMEGRMGSLRTSACCSLVEPSKDALKEYQRLMVVLSGLYEMVADVRMPR